MPDLMMLKVQNYAANALEKPNQGALTHKTYKLMTLIFLMLMAKAMS